MFIGRHLQLPTPNLQKQELFKKNSADIQIRVNCVWYLHLDIVAPSSRHRECYIFSLLDVKLNKAVRNLNGSHCHYFRGSRGYRKVDRIQPRKFVLLVFVTFVNDRLS